MTVPKPVSSSEDLYRTASELLKAEMKACSPAPLRLRLMGEQELSFIDVVSFLVRHRLGMADTGIYRYH